MSPTAMEWLMNELDTRGGPDGCSLSWKDLDTLIEKGRKMEKEQIEEAFQEGKWNSYEMKQASEYFKEKYKK